MTTQHVPFHITSGLPFGKIIHVTLPSGRDFWTNTGQIEILGQIRIADDFNSELIIDMAKFMTVQFAEDNVNVFTINLNMSSSDTRKVLRGGYYDIIVSDPLEMDIRAARLLEGPVFRDSVVTADKEELEYWYIKPDDEGGTENEL